MNGGLGRRAAAFAGLLLACECAATAFCVWRGARLPGGSAAFFAARMPLARLLLAGPEPRPAPAGLRDLGGVPAHDADYTRAEREEIVRPGWRELLPPDSLLGWRPARNVAFRHGPSIYLTGPQGFFPSGSGPSSYAASKPAGVFRLVVLGGSTVAGQGAESPSESLPARLAEAVRPPAGLRLEVINAGVHGYHSGQELLYLASELARYRPDLVVAYDGWNDHWANLGGLRRGGEDWSSLKSSVHYDNDEALRRSSSAGGAARGLRDAAILRVRHLLWSGSATTHLAMLAYGRARARVRAGRPPSADRPPDVPATVAAYRRNHRLMAAVARAEGFRLAWFLQPAMGVDGKELTEEEARSSPPDEAELDALRRFYAGARAAVASERAGGACAADLSRAFSRERGAIYADRVHVGSAGNRLLAGRIAAELRRCGFL